jgi:hypothetical protein
MAEKNYRTPNFFHGDLAGHDDDFVHGADDGRQPNHAGRPNQNAVIWNKHPEEVFQQRSNPGSAAWTEAPELLGFFAGGTSTEAERRIVQADAPAVRPHGGPHGKRQNPAKVND